MSYYYGFQQHDFGCATYGADGYRVGTVYVFDSREKRDDWLREDYRRDEMSSASARDWMLHFVGPWSRSHVWQDPITTHSSINALVDAYVDFAAMNGVDDVWNGV